MSDRQARVTQERERQGGPTAHAGQAGAEGATQGREVWGADVGHLLALDVAPQRFDGIEVRGVGRQRFHPQPVGLLSEVRPHSPALVRAQAVPDEDHALASEVPAERAQKRDEGPVGVGAGAGLKEEARAAAIPAKRQGAGDRQALPARPRVRQDRRVAPRRPGAPDNGLLGDPAFVLEEEPGAAAPGVFFSCAQRRVFQRAIAASSRSRARRPGRCSDQSSCWSRRPT